MRQFFAWAFVVAVAGASSAVAQTTTATEGLLKVCKVGGPGIPTGTQFTFTAGANTFTVPTGPAPGGTCVVGPRFPVGTHVTVAETVPPGYTVSSISVAPVSRQDGTPNLAGGSVNVTIGTGVTEVTFTDKRTGFLEICKTADVQGTFNFTVNPGGLGPFVVPAGACSPAIEVAAGTVLISELPTAGTVMSGCSTIPPAQQGPCNFGAQTSTVTVAPGDVSTMTIAYVTNKKVTADTGTDISLAKTFAQGTVAGTGAFALTVKNEGAPIATGTTIRIADPVPAGVTLTGLGGTSGTSWSCTPAFPLSGPATLTCTYTGTGTIASGALLPALVLNATLAAAGSQIGIYSNCATVALTTAAGPVTESNTANNSACTVTTKINTPGCEETGKCPQPVAACAQDVLMVVDASLSIGDGLRDVRSAIYEFLRPMQNKGGRVNIFSFNNQPNWTPITKNAWTAVTSSTWSTLPPIVLGGTKTNWDDALERARNVVAAAAGKPPLVLFLTDGNPNASNDPSGAEVDNTSTPVTAATEAVQWINAIRALGSPIIAVGFGPEVSAGYIDAAFTGNVSGPGSINFETSSVIKMDYSSYLPGVMATLANQMCGMLSLSQTLNQTSNFQVWHMVPAGATSVAVDDTLSFKLDLTNNTTTPINAVEVQDQVPGDFTGVTLVGTPSIGSATQTPQGGGNLITWKIPSLGARQTATLNFTGKLVKTLPVPPATGPQYYSYYNFAQVTAAQNYTATALGNMDPVKGWPTEVDEAAVSLMEWIYLDRCAAADKPVSCYVSAAIRQVDPENCNLVTGGTCEYSIGAGPGASVPAGSTLALTVRFMVGTTPLAGPWKATGPRLVVICPNGAPSTVPFTCTTHPGGIGGNFFVEIPPNQSSQLKNCLTATVTNTNTSPPLNVSTTACAP